MQTHATRLSLAILLSLALTGFSLAQLRLPTDSAAAAACAAAVAA
jgi:hypothetical protein